MSAEMDRMRDRVKNQTLISGLGNAKTDATEVNSPAYRNPAFVRQASRWDLSDDLWAGTEMVRDRKEKYLPKGQAEAQKDYDRRIQTAPFYNVYKRTVKGLTGLAMRKPPKLAQDAKAEFIADWKDIDLLGTSAPVFIKQLGETGQRYGHIGILVDYPQVPADTKLTLNDERRLGLRPYWCAIAPQQILNWRTMQRNGRTILSQVTLYFNIQEPQGLFGTTPAEEWRVYEIIGNSVWLSIFQKSASDKEMRFISSVRINNQTEIPLAIGYMGDIEGFMETRSALYELAHTNLDHYRVQADHRHSLHKASMPILVFKNRDTNVSAEEIVNPDWGIDVRGADGDVKYVEHAGSALNASRTEIQDIEQRMAAQGLSMLHRDTRTAETATANRLDRGEQNSTLGTQIQGLQNCVNQALIYHANFRKLPAPTTEFNYDFENLLLDAGLISTLSNLEVAGQITLETLWTLLERGGMLTDNFDQKKELAALLKSGARPDPNATPDPEDGLLDEDDDEEQDPKKPKKIDGGAGD